MFSSDEETEEKGAEEAIIAIESDSDKDGSLPFSASQF